MGFGLTDKSSVPGRLPSSIIRVQAPTATQRARLHLGKALWRGIGSPRHINLLLDGPRLVIRPCELGVGYTVVGGNTSTMPRVSLGEESRELLALDAGVYQAAVAAGCIVARLAMTPTSVPLIARPTALVPAPAGSASEIRALRLPMEAIARLEQLGDGDVAAGVLALLARQSDT